MTLTNARVQVFLNIVLDDAVEEKDGGEKVRIGTVVIRGNSVVMLEVRLLRQCVLLPAEERFLMCGIGIGENKLERRVRAVGTGRGFWGGDSPIYEGREEGRSLLYTILYTAVAKKKIGRNVIPGNCQTPDCRDFALGRGMNGIIGVFCSSFL